jgi:site-specific recombinase XerD
MHKGKRYRAEFPSYEEAAAWEAQQRANVLLGRPIEEKSKGRVGPAPSTLGGLVAWVSANHWKGKKSADTLIRNAELFVEFVGANVQIKVALSTDKVAEYCRDLEARGRSGSTVNRHLSAISTLSKFAASRQMLAARPALSWQHEGEGRLRFLEEWEFSKITETLRQWGREDDARFYEFLVDTGARLGEALKLTWQDVRPDRVIFVDRKSGRTTGTPTTARVRGGLLAIRKGPKGQDKGPFSAVTKGSQTALWRRLQTHLPFLADCVPHHTFRHTTASWLVQRGVDLFKVKEAMDHASIQTTMRYAHLAPKHMEDVMRALERTE